MDGYTNITLISAQRAQRTQLIIIFPKLSCVYPQWEISEREAGVGRGGGRGGGGGGHLTILTHYCRGYTNVKLFKHLGVFMSFAAVCGHVSR